MPLRLVNNGGRACLDVDGALVDIERASARRFASDPMAVPGFWDPRRRPERPDLSRINLIRFLTETDYPPFNYAGPDGNPIGFNIDLARMICEEIRVQCTVQMRRFDTLIGALNSNNGDAIIASIAQTPEMRARVDFSDPYYRTPARFVSRKDVEVDGVQPADLEGKRIGVIAGTAHEAYLRTLFTEVELHSYPNSDELRAALRRGEIDLMFLLLAQDLPDLLRDRVLAERIRLPHALAIGAHRVVFVLQVGAQHFSGILGELHRPGGGVGHAAEVIDDLRNGQRVLELLGGVRLELLRDVSVFRALERLRVHHVGHDGLILAR